ncbi:Uncharacterised protein [Serratia plymuthica]|nr:Uncharacterised protein [Serratia plymuthica]VEI16596.1 Uncharacterised protein [Serratia plymuthica]
MFTPPGVSSNQGEGRILTGQPLAGQKTLSFTIVIRQTKKNLHPQVFFRLLTKPIIRESVPKGS